MPNVFVDFKPAELKVTATETYIAYYAKNPATGKLERLRVRLNYIRCKRERQKYGLVMVVELNKKLYAGWNPFVEKQGVSKVVSVVDGARLYQKSYQKGLRPDSLRSYESFTKRFVEYAIREGIDKKPVFQFSKQDAQKYMIDIEESGVSPKTYNNYQHFQCQLFNFLVDKGLTKENPFAEIKTKRIDRKHRTTIPPEEKRRIFAYLDDNKMAEYKLICLLTYQCLIRPKEILQLRVRNIDLKSGLINIPSDVAKNHCERTVAMPANIREGLAKQTNGYPDTFFVFSSHYRPGKKMLSTRDTGRTWQQMRDELQLPECYQFYSLKDTGITEMLEAGVPAKLVQELADHHSIEMTQKYVAKSRAEEILKYNSVLEV